MFFKDIVGQDEVVKHLVRSVQEQRVAHAQMYSGPEGCGKMMMAIAYARYLCCENRGGDDACGTCASCIKYNKLAHPDLHFVFPVVKAKTTKPYSDDYIGEWREYLLQNKYISLQGWYEAMGAENQQGVIYAHQSEEIIKKLSLKTYESEYKVMIIYMPEKMNITCANKVLKLVEEPPEKTVFLMVSETPEQVITTILSRCQPISIPRVADAIVQKTMVEDMGVEPSQCEALARIAGGNMVKAKEIVGSTDANAYNFQMFVTVMRLCYGRKILEVKDWVEEMAKVGRERQKSFFQYAQRLVRENFIMNFQNTELNYLTPEEQGFSARFAPFINERNIIPLMEEFDLAEKHIAQNVNARMVFFDLSLKLIMLLKS